MVKWRSNYLFGGYGWLRVILHLFSEVGVLDQRSPRCYSAWNPPRAPYWDKGKAGARRPSLQEVSLSKQFECFRNMEKMSLGGLARSNKTYQNITFLPRFATVPKCKCNRVGGCMPASFPGPVLIADWKHSSKNDYFQLSSNDGKWWFMKWGTQKRSKSSTMVIFNGESDCENSWKRSAHPEFELKLVNPETCMVFKNA